MENLKAAIFWLKIQNFTKLKWNLEMKSFKQEMR